MIFSRLSPLLRMPLVSGLTRDTLLKMDPEIAHGATISALRLGLAPEQEGTDPPELRITLCGLDLKNPVGMAAGFDKNAEVPKPLARMGFGMVEVGTVTPRPQTGNPKPRLFRVGAAESLGSAPSGRRRTPWSPRRSFTRSRAARAMKRR